MASKTTDVRPKITLACVDCKDRNHITKKNRRNDPDRLEMKKFCPAAASTPPIARPADRLRSRRPPARHPPCSPPVRLGSSAVSGAGGSPGDAR